MLLTPNKTMKPLLLMILICLPLTAFAQEPSNYEKEIKAGIIAVGMTKEEIIEAIGEPYQKKENYWWYPDRKFIYFRDGKVRSIEFPIRAPKNEL